MALLDSVSSSRLAVMRRCRGVDFLVSAQSFHCRLRRSYSLQWSSLYYLHDPADYGNSVGRADVSSSAECSSTWPAPSPNSAYSWCIPRRYDHRRGVVAVDTPGRQAARCSLDGYALSSRQNSWGTPSRRETLWFDLARILCAQKLSILNQVSFVAWPCEIRRKDVVF